MQHISFLSAARPLCRAVLFAMCLSLTASAHAVELGEPVVRSHIGQPLVADIELTMLSDPTVPVLVRLSHPDVYRGANISVHPLLSNLTMSVMRRDGRQFLHITSIKPLEAEYLHLFLDLTQAGKRDVRAATLWLTPDPTPAPAPAPPVAAAPLAAPSIPVAPVPQPAVRRIAAAPAAPASCPKPEFSAEQVRACATIDYKNGLLSAQIVELEEKVKMLQLAIEGKGEVPTPVAPIAPVAPVVKGPVPIKPELPRKDKDGHKDKDQAGGFPWLLIGAAVAGVLALVGAGLFFFKRSRKGKGLAKVEPDLAGGTASDAAPESALPPVGDPSYMAKLKESLQRKKKEAKTATTAE